MTAGSVAAHTDADHTELSSTRFGAQGDLVAQA